MGGGVDRQNSMDINIHDTVSQVHFLSHTGALEHKLVERSLIPEELKTLACLYHERLVRVRAAWGHAKRNVRIFPRKQSWAALGASNCSDGGIFP